MNLELPKLIVDLRVEVIPPGDPRHRSNPEHPEHQLWLDQQAKKVKHDDAQAQ